MSDQFDPTKPCRTRDGREVRIYATDGGGTFPIHGATKEGEGWASENWTRCGHQQAYAGYTGSSRDLINVTPDVVRYVNIYPISSDPLGTAWSSREVADDNATDGPNRIAVLKITIRDGRDVSVEVERV